LNTPLGRPAAVKTSARMFAVRGVTSDGLKMKVFPAARAGAHFQSALENKKRLEIEISKTCENPGSEEGGGMRWAWSAEHVGIRNGIQAYI